MSSIEGLAREGGASQAAVAGDEAHDLVTDYSVADHVVDVHVIGGLD